MATISNNVVGLKKRKQNIIGKPNYNEINMIETYSTIFSSLSISSKIELMERLLKMLKSETEVIPLSENEIIPQKTIIKKDIFAEVRGIWADRDIDAKQLRKQVWGIE